LSYGMGLLLMTHLMGCGMQSYKTYCFFDTEAIEGIRSVAVLPFHNLSKQVNAGVIITNMVMAELVQYGKFRIVKFGDLREFLFQRRMTSVSTVDIETLRTLRKELSGFIVRLVVVKYSSIKLSV